ncbi:MAG: metal-dependent hydrolase [Desulfovibrio sp.]|nr:metal-dependent hydrolase [Desulfovibrio sp.]
MRNVQGECCPGFYEGTVQNTMTWKTHEVSALAMMVAFGYSAAATAAAFFGAVLPDLLDQRLASLLSVTRQGRQRAFRMVHRGGSHWFGIWLGGVYAAFFAERTVADFLPPSVSPVFVRDILLGLSLGALSHILLDALTPMGVPAFPFFQRPRLALPLCRTGSFSEAVFFLLAVGLLLYVSRGFWLPLFPSLPLSFSPIGPGS